MTNTTMTGRYVRRIDERTHRYTPWAHISMTLPSRSGECWLVTFIDGAVDVWPVDDPVAGYQFRTAGEDLTRGE